jgi:hypothetical protein
MYSWFKYNVQIYVFPKYLKIIHFAEIVWILHLISVSKLWNVCPRISLCTTDDYAALEPLADMGRAWHLQVQSP